MSDRQPIDPDLRRYLDELAASAPAVADLDDQARAEVMRSNMVRALEKRDSIPGLPNGVNTRDLEIARGFSARLYSPANATDSLPLLVYLHGGGWVAGSVATHDPFCRLLSEAAHLHILSVEYRVAPEHAYPAAVEDSVAAFRWAAEHAVELGATPARLALGGDSAGGNLAAVAANQLGSGTTEPPLAALLLLYPVTDHPCANHPSYTENGSGYGLDAGGMRWYWEQYAQGASPDDPHLSPLRMAHLPKLPPTFIATAEYDVLRDEGLAYAKKLKAAGVDLTHMHAPDMHHNFPVHPGTVARFPQSLQTFDAIAEWLRTTLG
jgi:acetyl esterase